MNGVIGDVFPIAFAIAVSPIPISAVVLLMLGNSPGRNGIMFIVGWFIGVGLPASLVAVAVDQLARAVPAAVNPAVEGTLLLLLGLVCWLFGWRVWSRRPKPGAAVSEPKWMRTLTDATPLRALVLGLALSLLNPEDLMLALSGGAVIGGAHLPTSQLALVLLLFTVLSSLTVIVPPVVYAVGRDRAAPMLAEAKAWLIQHNALLMALLLAMIGAVVIGHGIQAF